MCWMSCSVQKGKHVRNKITQCHGHTTVHAATSAHVPAHAVQTGVCGPQARTHVAARAPEQAVCLPDTSPAL